MKRIGPILLLACCSTLLSFCSNAQEPGKEEAFINLYRRSGKTAPATSTYLVKLKPERIAEIRRSNLLRQLSPSLFIIRSNDPMGLAAIASRILPANDNWKLSPTLLAVTTNVTAGKVAAQNDWYSLTLIVTDAAAFKMHLSQLEEPVQNWEEYNGGLFTLTVRRETFIFQLLSLPELIFADLRQPKARDEQVLNDVDLSMNLVPLAHRKFPAITGSGVTGSVREDRFDTADIDFKGRVLPTLLSSTLLSSHATVMATIIGGGGNSYYSGQGVAYRSVLSSLPYTSLLPDADATYQLYGISVQNHSYGSDIENYYGAEAVAHDRSARDNPSLLHVFSAGNSGDQSATSGAYVGIGGMADLTGNYKMAKNILTVGSIDSFGIVSPLSSKGPAYDGRVKPELVAFGQDGSSGAAAIVSGVSLLVQQAYKEQSNGQLPPSDLVRAILLNSADDVDAAGIDYNSGYGSVNAYRALTSVGEKRYATGAVSNGAVQTYPLSIPANSRHARVTLAWNDPAAIPNAYTALVNDLDLELVYAASGETWLPWVLNSRPFADSLRALPQRKRDSLNNVEQVSLEGVAAGDYIIRVRGTSVPVGPQSYSLAWQWDSADSFQWAYPTGNDNLLAGSSNLVRWQTTLPSPARLEYSIDAGKSWQLIDAAVDLAKNSVYWKTPDTLAAVLLRITAGTQSWYSDTFSIAKPLTLSVGFNCPDSVFLYWNAVPGAAGYRVFDLGDQSLEPMRRLGGPGVQVDSSFAADSTLTGDTTLLFAKATHPSLHYAVAPVLSYSVASRPASLLTGRKSYTINYADQGVGCYVESFTADPQDGRKARLALDLGTLYHIRGIGFEKQSAAGYQSLAVIGSLNGLQYTVQDGSLSQGINTYRVKITLQDGRIIYSEEESIDYLAGRDYLIYPNPLNGQSFFTILSADPASSAGSGGAQLQLYNVLGQKVYEARLTGSPVQVPVSGLASGLYLLVILKEGRKTSVGKVLVN